MESLAYIYWGISPDIVKLGPITIRWYGLLFALGFVVGYQIMYWVFNSEGKKLKDLESFTISMIIGTVVGARLGHCFFYEPSFYLSNPIEILFIWKGGLASHGAGIGILIALILYTRKHTEISFPWVIDRVVLVIPLAACFIRLGNFFNSEILGMPANLPWAVVFTNIDTQPRHPAQLYESISYLAIFFLIFVIYKKFKAQTPRGLLIGLFLSLMFGARFFIEFAKERQASFELALPIDMGQLLSIPFFLAGVIFVVTSIASKHKNKKQERIGT